MNNTLSRQAEPQEDVVVFHAKTLLKQLSHEMIHPPQKPGRGRPPEVSSLLLALSVLWCFLQGHFRQLAVWRLIYTEGQGPFAPVQVDDQTIYRALADRGTSVMKELFELTTQRLSQRLEAYRETDLASFTTAIYAIDESILDKMPCWLAALRQIKNGSKDLLAGRIAAVFDVRLQLWLRVDLLPEAKPHCMQHARQLLQDLPKGALLLFDLGYKGFQWFDDVQRAGFWYITRLDSRYTFERTHTFIQREDCEDFLVFLGSNRSDHAEFVTRIVRIRHAGIWFSYLTNVIDPWLLPAGDIARLYARRWDIEMGFRIVKDYLHMKTLWSAKWSVIQVQIWATFLLAQLLQATRIELARALEVPVFDLSLPLLSEYLPLWQQEGKDVVKHLRAVGREIKIIRPSTRYQIEEPDVPLSALQPMPPDLPLRREPRYGQPSPFRAETAPGQRKTSARKKSREQQEGTQAKKPAENSAGPDP